MLSKKQLSRLSPCMGMMGMMVIIVIMVIIDIIVMIVFWVEESILLHIDIVVDRKKGFHPAMVILLVTVIHLVTGILLVTDIHLFYDEIQKARFIQLSKILIVFGGDVILLVLREKSMLPGNEIIAV